MKNNLHIESIIAKMIVEELDSIIQAKELASDVHAGQERDTGKPYISHLKEVQRLAKQMGYGINVQIIALLHDTIEDAKNPNVIEKIIEKKFGSHILRSVLYLTHSKAEHYSEYLYKLAVAPNEDAKNAFKVKMLDMYHNLSENPTETQVKKYHDSIQYLIQKGLKDSIPKMILDKLGINDEITEAEKKNPGKKASDKKDKKDKEDAGEKETPKGPEAEDPFAGPEKESPPDAGGKSGVFGEPKPNEDPFGEPAGPGGLGAPPTGGEDAGEAEGEPVAQYNEKEKEAVKIIPYSRSEQEPGFKFGKANQFYVDNYVSETKNGSLLIAIPEHSLGDESSSGFLNDYVMNKINNTIKIALQNQKRVVLIGDYGLPYINGEYQKDEIGAIAKYLNTKYPKGYILFDTWNPKDYEAFTAASKIWDKLKERTEAKDIEIKAAMYLNTLYEGNKEVSEKLKSKNVSKVLDTWGLDDQTLRLSDKASIKNLLEIIHPEMFGKPQTLPGLIINTYLYLLRVALVEKVYRYEKKGISAIVPIDKETAWYLKGTFDHLDELEKLSKKAKEEPKESPEETSKEPEEKEKK